VQTDTFLKAEAATITLTAVDGGRIRVNSLSMDEPKVIAAKELQVRTDGKLVLVRRRHAGK
jgi:hypothetical protein